MNWLLSATTNFRMNFLTKPSAWLMTLHHGREDVHLCTIEPREECPSNTTHGTPLTTHEPVARLIGSRASTKGTAEAKAEVVLNVLQTAQVKLMQLSGGGYDNATSALNQGEHVSMAVTDAVKAAMKAGAELPRILTFLHQLTEADIEAEDWEVSLH